MKAPKGVFCGNFAHSRNPWTLCHQVWCGSCYKVGVKLAFHIEQPMNDQGVMYKRKANKDRFLVGWKGDSLMQPF